MSTQNNNTTTQNITTALNIFQTTVTAVQNDRKHVNRQTDETKQNRACCFESNSHQAQTSPKHFCTESNAKCQVHSAAKITPSS